MADYKNYLDKISGDTMIIIVEPPMIPVTGIASIVDWRLNSLLSRLILEESYTGSDGSVLLLCTEGRLPVEKVILVGAERSTVKKLVKIVQGLRCRNFCVAFNNNIEEKTKDIFSEFKHNGINWNTSGSHKFKNETLITFKGVDYGEHQQGKSY
ncbi:MAG: hypothetical protein JXA66_09035 [Oligoflexia bacterium]|nr:hypothetical protein [Oligoflexia bacterium]